MKTDRNHNPLDLRDFAAQALAQRLSKMLAQAEGALSGEQSEPIHQMRVWSRRTRAAHDLFEFCFPGKEYRALGRELKRVTDALGAARDLDVMIGSLREEAETLPPEQRAGIDRFITRLSSRRRARQKAVIRAMHRLERCRLAERFSKLLGDYGAALKPSERSERRVAAPQRGGPLG